MCFVYSSIPQHIKTVDNIILGNNNLRLIIQLPRNFRRDILNRQQRKPIPEGHGHHGPQMHTLQQPILQPRTQIAYQLILILHIDRPRRQTHLPHSLLELLLYPKRHPITLQKPIEHPQILGIPIAGLRQLTKHRDEAQHPIGNGRHPHRLNQRDDHRLFRPSRVCIPKR
jgi:hypothetical protein